MMVKELEGQYGMHVVELYEKRLDRAQRWPERLMVKTGDTMHPNYSIIVGIGWTDSREQPGFISEAVIDAYMAKGASHEDARLAGARLLTWLLAYLKEAEDDLG